MTDAAPAWRPERGDASNSPQKPTFVMSASLIASLHVKAFVPNAGVVTALRNTSGQHRVDIPAAAEFTRSLYPVALIWRPASDRRPLALHA